MRDDDLSLLGVSPSDRRRLEAMGITTLEQIVLMDRYSLGLSKGKSDSLIQAAANILANRHIKDVQIQGNRVIITTQGAEETVLVAMAKEIFGSLGEYSFTDNQIIIMPGKSPYGGDFRYILQNAKRWLDITSAKSRGFLQREGITLSEHELTDFARERGIAGFIQNVFGEIKGNELMKWAITAAMFSSFREPLHVLVVGEPGSGKTMARDIIVESFSDIVPIGANSTRAGLVCNRATGELGALAAANEKLALIDEFDKLNEDDVQHCYELFSNAKCQVDTARIHTTLESHFTAIAFANPKWEVFKGRPMDEIGIRATMLSRFALIVPSEMLGPDVFKEILAQKLTGESELKSLPHYYDQWVKLSRHHKPQIQASEKLIDSYMNEGAALYERYCATPLRRDHRMADYLARLPKTIARAEFSDVTDQVLERSLQLVRDSISAWD